MKTPENIVYFAHGKESGPWGTKITALAKIARHYGYKVESPDYSSTMDPDERVKMLLALKPAARENLLLVGSSMGGYVSAVASKTLKPKGLFLMAPAFFIKGYKVHDPAPHAQFTLLVHGRKDDLIPPEYSIRYARQHVCQLALVDSDHPLTSALPVIEILFTAFLEKFRLRK